jgi:hypothetical protein
MTDSGILVPIDPVIGFALYLVGGIILVAVGFMWSTRKDR